LQSSRFTLAYDDDVDVNELALHTARGPRQSHHDLHHSIVSSSDSLENPIGTVLYEEHAQMLRTVIKAGEDPQHEDNFGRNGFHCLAEVSLTLSGNEEPKLDNAAQRLCPRRQCYLNQLLQSGVNPNSYDCEGCTPLMSFIIDIRDESDDQTIQLLGLLLEGGANINNRNRQGESALHIAVRLDRRNVTQFLLYGGANVYARTSRGFGVLAHGVKYGDKASVDSLLYAQICLCVDLVGRAGAIAAPTILDEWASRELMTLIATPAFAGSHEGRRR